NDALNADPDRELVEGQRLAGFVEHGGHADLAGVLPERAVARMRVDDDRRAERLRHAPHGRVRKVGPYLREVGTAHRARVQVDAVVGLRHDFRRHHVGEPRGEGARAAAGERAIQVAPVGQVARLVDEAEHVHDRHGEDAAPQALQDVALQHPPDDLDPVELVAVDRCREEQRRPVPAAVHHVHRDVQVRVRVQCGDGQLDGPAGPRGYRLSADLDCPSFHSFSGLAAELVPAGASLYAYGGRLPTTPARNGQAGRGGARFCLAGTRHYHERFQSAVPVSRSRRSARDQMPGLYFEEFEVGQVFRHPIRRTITEADNVWFTALTHNPAPLHLDAEYCKTTEFGRPLVNSCLTLAFMVGISVGDTTLGTTVANLGWDEVRFPKPLFHGDTIRVETEVLELRESRSRPQNGIVVFSHRAFNQHGELVGICKRSALMLRKPT